MEINRYRHYEISDNIYSGISGMNKILKSIVEEVESSNGYGVIIDGIKLDEESLKRRIIKNESETKYLLEGLDVEENHGVKFKYNIVNVFLDILILNNKFEIEKRRYRCVKSLPYRMGYVHEYDSIKDILEESFYINAYEEAFLSNRLNTKKTSFGYNKNGEIEKLNLNKVLVYLNIESFKVLRKKHKEVSNKLNDNLLLNSLKSDLKKKVELKLKNKEVYNKRESLKTNLPNGVNLMESYENGGEFIYTLSFKNKEILVIGTNFLYKVIALEDGRKVKKLLYNLSKGSTLEEAKTVLESYRIELLDFIYKLLDGRKNPLK